MPMRKPSSSSVGYLAKSFTSFADSTIETPSAVAISRLPITWDSAVRALQAARR